MTFGQKLRKLLKENGYTQKRLSEELFISYHSLWRWVHDYNEPGLKDVKRICELFHVSADWLLGVNEESTTTHLKVRGL